MQILNIHFLQPLYFYWLIIIPFILLLFIWAQKKIALKIKAYHINLEKTLKVWPTCEFDMLCFTDTYVEAERRQHYKQVEHVAKVLLEMKTRHSTYELY